MLNKKAVGKRLRELRVKSGETLQETASHIGVSKQSISHYESGRRVPSPEVMEKIADHFGLTVGYIFFRKDST
jgi:transcriptional regulator with XRE-family HTH domain